MLARIWVAMAFGLAVASLDFGSAIAAETPGLVKTAAGVVKGAAENDVMSFKGIPFAAPPVGELRWRAPQPAPSWTGVRMADQFGPACMQHQPRNAVQPISTSEDCLTLNVWVPAKPQNAKLPVMVWIFGGAFVSGAGSFPAYDGANLAKENVIVVTLNYRLGRFGWFGHPALTKENPNGPLGNYGLMDQIAALQWVQQNIAAFGGDVGNVTIFGESAGGMSVNLLMISPAAKGLFHKAITESGLGRTPARPLHGEGGKAPSAEALGETLAKSAGVADDDLKALRAIPADRVLGPPLTDVTDSGNPLPIVDGRIVPKNVDEAFAHGEQYKIPFLIGTNDNEASLFPFVASHPESVLGPLPPEARAKIVELYDVDKTGDQSMIAAGLSTDTVFTEPARFLARSMMQAGAPVYLYRFAYVAEKLRNEVAGAGHGSEVVYVFNTLGARFAAANDHDKAVAKQMSAYWVSFARNGDPNGADRPNWPRYAAGDDALLEFSKDGPVARHNEYRARLDMISARYAATSGGSTQ
jgi:para-nitrobenzyl esterase